MAHLVIENETHADYKAACAALKRPMIEDATETIRKRVKELRTKRNKRKEAA